MDWYYGSGIDDDLIVPKDGNLSDRLPSPDSWSKWGISEPDIFQSQYKSSVFSSEFTAEEDVFNAKCLSDEVEMEDSVHDKYYDQSTVTSLHCGFSGESSQKTGPSSNQPDYQLDLAGSGRMDDIFLSSLQEDIPRIENLDESFCSSPKSQYGTTKFNCRERDANLELQNELNDVPSLGSLRYLKTHAFSPSLGSEKDCSLDSEIVGYNLLAKYDPSIKDPSMEESVPSEKNNVNGHSDEDTSLEDVVLLDLKMVTNQLSEKTRICIRDALYRLARNSNQHRVMQNQQGDLFMEIPPPCPFAAETTRSGTKRPMELETNVIDRAVASLMFGKTDFNVHDLPSMAALSNYKAEVSGASESFDRRSFQ